MTQVFLTATGAGSFPNPGNWNPLASKIEGIGGGATGSAGNVAVIGGGGGGGGAYAYANNVSLTFPVSYYVAPLTAPASGVSSPNPTSFGPMSAPSALGVQSATSNVPSNGGGSQTGGTFPVSQPNGYQGGDGGAGNFSYAYPGGGGGAGGPHGAGGTGVASTNSASGGGGSADGAWIPGGAVGAVGQSGKLWDTAHGCGSGGGGASSATVAAGAGGSYGGGGAGGWGAGSGAGVAGGLGTQGIIILTYLPLGTVQVFLIATGIGSFPDPGNWNPVSNLIEALSCGGGGGPSGSPTRMSGGGGGGSGYAYANNLALTFPVAYYVTPANSSGAGSSFGADTNTGSWTGGYTKGVAAQQGNQSLSSSGNTGGTFYPNGFAGGSGGNGVAGSTSGGGGGGGAGGPHGAGLTGGVGGASSTFGAGGAADGGVVVGAATNAATGNMGAQWNPWGTPYGCGSGGAGSTTGNGGVGGNYGGGGGGASSTSVSYNGGGTGAGIIILTYLALTPAGAVFLMS